MFRARPYRIILAVVLIATQGCMTRSLHAPRPAGAELSEEMSSELVSSLTSCETQVRSFRGLARATMTQGDERSAFRYAVVFQKPNKLRLEALPTSAVYTLSLLLTDNQELLYLDPAAKSAHRGPVDAPALNRFLGLPLLPPDLMALLTACVPSHIAADGISKVYEDKSKGVVQVLAKGIVYELASGTLEPRRAYLINTFDDRVAALVEWSGFRYVQGRSLPANVKITIPAHSVSLDLNFTSSEINGDYPERLFHAEIPAGYELR